MSINAKKRRGSIIWRYVLLPLICLVLLIHLGIGAMLLIWQQNPVNYSMFMAIHAIQGGQVSQIWVEGNQIAKSAKLAAIASEDANFVRHHGFDVDGIKNAIKANQEAGAVAAGGSTISQQLAKNLFLSSHRSYIRKAEEAVITVMIETLWDKERILTVYLNVAEFGEGVYGIEAASRHYFNKSAKNLTKDEAALLISMLPNPKYYQKNLKNKRLQNKKRLILKRMPTATLPKGHV